MKNKKIDLSNIKVAIFDFDDTLAIHKDKDFIRHRNESEDNLFNYYLNAYSNPETFYEIIEPCLISVILKKLIKILETKGIKMYCVSGMKYSFHFKAKENFIHKFYSDKIELISTCTQELKCNVIKMIKRINNCNLDEILFIDDIKENIIKFNDMGINAFLPEDIDEMMSEN